MGVVEGIVNRVKRAGRHAPMHVRRAREAVYYRMRDDAFGTAILKAAAFAAAPRETRHRRRMAATYNAVTRPLIDPVKGYGLFPPDYFSGIDAVLLKCRTLFEIKRAAVDEPQAATGAADPTSSTLARKRKFLQNLLTNDDLGHNPDLVDFALCDAAFGIATHYLGTIPSLTRVDLLYSVPRESDSRISSQLFHVDPEGVSQVKLFINVFDTGEAEGPFTFIPADETARIRRDIRALRRRRGEPQVGRYTDDEVAAVGGTGAIVTVKGPSGGGVAVDTCRCLHLGSRVEPGAFRLCLYLQYCISREHSNVFDIDRFRNDPVRYLAVKHSTAWAGTDVTAPHQMAT